MYKKEWLQSATCMELVDELDSIERSIKRTDDKTLLQYYTKGTKEITDEIKERLER